MDKDVAAEPRASGDSLTMLLVILGLWLPVGGAHQARWRMASPVS